MCVLASFVACHYQVIELHVLIIKPETLKVFPVKSNILNAVSLTVSSFTVLFFFAIRLLLCTVLHYGISTTVIGSCDLFFTVYTRPLILCCELNLTMNAQLVLFAIVNYVSLYQERSLVLLLS